MITAVNNTQPTFGKFSIIKVHKNAFCNQQTFMSIEDAFEQRFNKALSKKDKINSLFNKMFSKNSAPYVFFLEQPNFAFLMDKLKEFGGYSLEWLHMHTGVPIYRPLDEDYHSFFVLTEDELDVQKILKENVDDIVQETTLYKEYRTSQGELYDELTKEAFINHYMTSLFMSMIQDVPADVYKIEDFSDIKQVAEQIMS